MSIPEDLRTTVLTSVANFLGGNPAAIKPESNLEEDLQLDSTDIVDIFVDLEKKLKISLTGVRFADLKTVNGLIEVVAARMPELLA